MMKLNAMEFVAGAAVDLVDEFDDLNEKIKACRENPCGTTERAMRRQYSHLNSLLTGFKYMAGYMDDQGDQDELLKVIAGWEDWLGSYWQASAQASWRVLLNSEDVHIEEFHHADGSMSFSLTVGKDHIESKRREDIIDYLRTLLEEKED